MRDRRRPRGVVAGIQGGDEMDLWRAKRLLVENGYVYNENEERGVLAHSYQSLQPYRVDTDPDAEPRPALVERIVLLAPEMIDPLVSEGSVTLVYEYGALRLDDHRRRFSREDDN